MQYLESQIPKIVPSQFMNPLTEFLIVSPEVGGDSFENFNGRLGLSMANTNGATRRIRLLKAHHDGETTYQEYVIPATTGQGIIGPVDKRTYNFGRFVHLEYPDGVTGLTFLVYYSPLGPRNMDGRNQARSFQ